MTEPRRAGEGRGSFEKWMLPESCPRCAAQAAQTRALREALEESVKLQSHYAGLLNMYDGGRRIEFKDADAWLARLAALAAAPREPA